MIKRLIATLFFLSLAFLIAALIAPGFIDWNPHKEKILAQLSPYFQRKIDVAGNISFKLIPQPEIMLESVTIENLITLKQLQARIKPGPLLEGRIEIETIVLVEPVLTLEISSEGKANWPGILVSPEDWGMTAESVRLNQLMVTRGTLNYINQQTGSKKIFENLNLAIAADTLLGPYRIFGDMLYQGSPVKIEMDIGAYNKTMPAPLRLSFTPAEGLPQVKFNGVADLQSGLGLQGEVSIAQGRLTGLFNYEFLKTLGFANDIVDMTAVLEVKGSQFTLNDIKAKFGKAGGLKGKIAVQLAQGAKPLVAFDLDGNNLVVTEKHTDATMDVPRDFEGTLNFTGKDIIWEGGRLEAVDISVAFDQKDWLIKSAEITLPGPSQIRLAGTVTPGTDSAAYTKVQVTTEDPGKLAEAAGNMFLHEIFTSAVDMELTAKNYTRNGLKIEGTSLKENPKGSMDFHADTVTLEGFNFSTLGSTVQQLTSVPENLQQVIDDLLRKNGPVVFKDVQGRFKVDREKIIVEALKLPGTEGTLMITGSADIKTGSYSLSGDLALNKPEGFPVLKVTRTSEMPDYTVDSSPLKEFIIRNNPAPVPEPEPELPPVPEPMPIEQDPPPTPSPEEGIGDILKRLEEDPAP